MLTTILLSTMMSSAALAQSPAKSQDIVVIGRRIKDAEAALKACIARGCPPDEEIDASLALAETQIIAGDYKDARSSLLRALSRNKDEAERYPIPVSDLYRANGRVAAHLGYDRDYYSSTWGIYRTLKKGLPSAEVRHFQAKMEVAEMMFRTRGHERARLYYRDIVSEARAAGRHDIAAIAELRSAMRHLPPELGNKVIAEIANNRDPKMRAPALEATLALARRAYERGDDAEADTIRKQFARFDIKRPILIYSPPYKLHEGALNNGSAFDSGHSFAVPTGGNPENGPAPVPTGSAGQFIPPGGGVGRGGTPPSFIHFNAAQFSSTKRIAGNFDDMWMDVAFEVTPEGKVANAKVTRRSRGAEYWTRPVMDAVKARIYTPSSSTANTKRLERYTYTSGYEGKTDTRVAGRSPAARIEYFDLSEEGASVQQ